MKLTIITILLINGIVATMAVSLGPALAAECIAMANLSDADAKLNKLTYEYLVHPEKAPRTIKCFYDCMFKKLDLIDASGSIKVERISNIMIEMGVDKSNTQAIIEKCADIKGDDDCEKLFNYRVCLHQEAEKIK